MSTVRALIVVSSIKKDAWGNTFVEAYPTQGSKAGDKEAQDFNTATPGGKVELTIAKDRPAADFFVPGEEVYVTFEKRTQATE